MEMRMPEVLMELVDYADKGEHIPFELISSWTEYLFIYKKLKALKSIIKILSSGSDALLKLYCKDVENLQGDLTALLVSKALAETIEFYKEDVKTVNHMLDEYEIYLLSGNLLNFGNRHEDDLWDHREADLWNKL